MVDNRITTEMRNKEINLINRFTIISKLLILLTIFTVILFIVIFMGTYIWNYGYNWAVLGFDIWALVLSAILTFFVLINFLLYFRCIRYDKKRKKFEKPEPEFIDGKRVHVLTFPKGSEGGIFSKTYIKIDEHNLLRLRLLMIRPSELWTKFKEVEETE